MLRGSSGGRRPATIQSRQPLLGSYGGFRKARARQTGRGVGLDREAKPRLRFLGTFGLFDKAGTKVELTSKKSIALLALLAAAPDGSRMRSWLQSLLWEARALPQAQSSLRRELSSLRGLLDAHGLRDVLFVNRQMVQLRLDRLEIDTRDLAVTRVPDEAAGQYLEGLDLNGCEGFEDWLRQERSRISQLFAPSLRTMLGAPPDETPAAPGHAPAGRIERNPAPDGSPRPPLVVLPFESSGSNSLLGDGIAYLINDELARYPQLFVVSTVSAIALVRDKMPIRQISETLKVRYLVTGEISESDGQIQARVRLVEAPTLQQVWSGNFVESSESLSVLQQRIAASIIPQIWTTIDINERHKSLSVPLTSRSSYELYWRADALFRKLDEASANEAVCIAEELVRTNPDSAWAYAMSAFCNGTAYANGWTTDPAQTRDIALAHYQNALRLDHDNVQVLGYAAGTLVAVGGSMQIADKLINRALALLPDHSSTLFWGGWVDLISGKPERARQRLARGMEITPIWSVRAYAVAGIGLSHLLQGQMETAFELLFEAYVQDPDYPFSAAGLCIAAVARGDHETAHQVGSRLTASGKDTLVLRMLQDPMHRAMFSYALAHATAPEMTDVP